jgi:hypothetical protein
MNGSHATATGVYLNQNTASPNYGKVLLAGGDSALSGAELFTDTNSSPGFTSIPPLSTGRDSYVALALQTGVLFAGGSDGNGDILSSAELYMPDVAAPVPQWPAGTSNKFIATETGPTSVYFTWPAATDPNGVAHYILTITLGASDAGATPVSVTLPGTSTSYAATNLPGTPVSYVLTAVDPYGNAEATAVLSIAAAVNGTACNDGNPCTTDDTVQNGYCSGITVTCAPADSCHVVGTCNPTTGLCSNPPMAVPAPSADAGMLTTCDPQRGVVSVAVPAVDPTVTTTIVGSASFLYAGTTPLQRGVDAGTIAPTLATVVRGKVYDTSGNALVGAVVSVVSHPELGTTTTLTDGTFSMGVNGGGTLVFNFSLMGYLSVQRTVVNIPWNGWATADDVALVPVDSNVTLIDTSGTYGSFQIARGTTTPEDTDGTAPRTAVLLFPPGTTATLTGTTTAPTSLHVHATEYTKGPYGTQAMPASLPPSSAYTYCVGYTADEEDGGAGITFANSNSAYNNSVISYTDNFLSLPIGTPDLTPGSQYVGNIATHIPVGSYSMTTGAWVPMTDGLVLNILANSSGVAQIDMNGDGIAESASALEGIGITLAEQEALADAYPTPGPNGTSVWRVLIPHFSEPWDYNMGVEPPPGATAPNVEMASMPVVADDGCKSGEQTNQGASTLECQNGILHESIPVTGTPYTLEYSSDRVIGYTAGYTLTIPMTGSGFPMPGIAPPNGVVVEVQVAGRSFSLTDNASAFAPSSFPSFPSANLSTTFTWDGFNALGQLTQGVQIATVRVGYVYNVVYTLSTPPTNNGGCSGSGPCAVFYPPINYDTTFGHFTWFGSTTTIARNQVTIWQISQVPIGSEKAEALNHRA